jgi:hypothetical protein
MPATSLIDDPPSCSLTERQGAKPFLTISRHHHLRSMRSWESARSRSRQAAAGFTGSENARVQGYDSGELAKRGDGLRYQEIKGSWCRADLTRNPSDGVGVVKDADFV